MNIIHLTEEQHKKLLEMAKKLFPENENWEWFTNKLLEYRDKSLFYIHWYEFCILHLSIRLFEALVKKGLYEEDEKEDWLYDDLSWLAEPIEFLYQEFKKL